MAASRKFVCVRLATYENEAAATFLKSIYTGRSGEVENTTFVLLGPGAEKRLSRAGRGPHMLLGERGGPPSGGPRGGPPGSGPADDSAGEDLAAVLEKAAKPFRAKAELRALPQTHDFRRALNIAACDSQPLVVALATSDEARSKLEKRIEALAWSEALVGRYHYVLVKDKAACTGVEGVPAGDGVFVVSRGTYGTSGKVIAKVAASANDEALRKMLEKTEAAFDSPNASRSHRDHVRSGRRLGEWWESEVPVTDPEAARATRRR